MTVASASCGQSERDSGAPSTAAYNSGEPQPLAPAAGPSRRPGVSLGMQVIGRRSVSALRLTDVVPGGPAEFQIGAPPDSNNPSVRFWIGSLDATTTDIQPASGDPATGRFEARGLYPDPLPDNAVLWIEIEDFNGDIKRGAFPLTK